MLGRRILSEEEKQAVMEHWHYQCYVCRGDIINTDEAEFVHMVPLDRGGTFSLENYAPLHNYCYLKAAEQDLEFARDDAQINASFSADFDSIFEVRRVEPAIAVDTARMMVSVDDESVRLYQCPNSGIYYFYHQIPAAYLEADPKIVPHGLERQRVVALIGHLREHPQLNPVICRLVDGHLRIVAGLHRTAAQYLGNHNLRIDCKVLVDADPTVLVRAEQASRSGLRTRPRKPAPLTDWLLHEYRPQITAWQEIHPDRELTEAVVLYGVLANKEPQAVRTLQDFLETWLKGTLPWQRITARCQEAAVRMPDNLSAILVRSFMQTWPGRAALEGEADFRQEETENMMELLEMLLQEGLFPEDNGTPFNPALLQTQLREEGAMLWGKLLADASRIVLQRRGDDGVCYGPRFVPLEKARIRRMVQSLFQHPFWQDLDLDRAFRQKDRLSIEKSQQKWGLNHSHLLRS